MTASKAEPYNIVEHRHRFAMWTAARAVARGFAGTSVIKIAIDGTGLRALAADPESWPALEADSIQDELISQLMMQFAKLGVFEKTKSGQRKNPLNPENCYGIAAKVVAIYLKATIIIGANWQHPFASRIYPPIDRTLLKNLCKKHDFARDPDRKGPHPLKWTELNKTRHKNLIDEMRKAELDKDGFWRVEKDWSPEQVSATDRLL